MTERPRILIIENSVDVTGALKSIFAMANDLSDRYEFIFLLPSGSRCKEWLQSRTTFRVVELPMLEISKSLKVIFYLPMLLINSLRLAGIIRKLKIDIVHSNDLYNLVGRVAKMFTRFKYVCHIRFLPDRFPPALYNRWLSIQGRAGTLIAVSNFLRKKISADRKITVVHDRIIPAQNHPDDVMRNNNTILCLGNIIQGKGQDQAIDAFARIHTAFPFWTLRIVGGTMGKTKNELYNLRLIRRADELGVLNKIEWKDFADDVELEYKTADIFVNFSSSESFSMTCLESLWYGCPVVATKSGGPAEIIDDGQSGYLVRIGDIDAMTASIKRLIENWNARETMGAHGTKSVREKFSVANTSELLHGVYADILR